MPYNPDVEGYIWEVYRVFRRITPPSDPEYRLDKDDFNLLFKCVIAFCDRYSPFADERDFKERWNDVWDYFKVKKGGNVWLEIQQYTEVYRQLVLTYYKVVCQYDYQVWMGLKTDFHQKYNYLTSVLDPDSIEASIKARDSVSKGLEESLKNLQRKEAVLFNDDYLKQIVAEESVQDELAGWAEKFARVPSYLN